MWFRMFLIIIVILVPLSQSGSCPLPGIPDKAVSVLARGQQIEWSDRFKFDSFTPGEHVSYECDSITVKRPEENSKITCQEDGHWSSPPPRCYGFLTLIGHEFNYKDDGQYSFQKEKSDPGMCERGDKSNSFIISLDAENVPGHLAFLDIRPCRKAGIKLVTLGGSACKRITNFEEPGTSHTFSCVEAKPQESKELYIELDSKGDLSSVNGFYAEQCGFPPVPVNGYVSAMHFDLVLLRKIVTYGCKANHELIGSETISCNNINGKWQQPPECRWNPASLQRVSSLLYVCIAIGLIISILLITLIGLIWKLFFIKRVVINYSQQV